MESLFSSTVGISSGPFALCSLRLDSKLITPSFCMVTEEILGYMLQLRVGIVDVSSDVNTDVK